LRHIRVFFNWAVKNGLIQENPTDDVNKKPVDETLSQKIITEMQLQLLLDTHKAYIDEQAAIGTISKNWQRQDWFRPLIMTYFYVGLRLTEALNLQWRDIDLPNRTLTVRKAKGGKTVVIALTKKIAKELADWKTKATGELVFASPKQNLSEEIPLFPKTVQRIFKRLVRKAGLGDTIHIHSLRHSCVTYLLSNGVDILSVNKTLRHTSLDVTRRYEHLSPNDIRDKFEKLDL
jgi:integrase/recombinase XerD